MKKETFIFIQELKKRVLRWRVVAFICIFCLVISSSGNILNEKTNKDIIARVKIEGVINDGVFSYDSIKELKNDNVKGIILDINSGGGDVVESEKLYYAFRNLSKIIPVVSVINSVGASGAYMVAMASDYIISYMNSTVGSLGVLLQTYEITELAKKIGVTLVNYKSSPLKAAPNPMEKVNPDVDMVMSQQINDIYDYFINIFVERRKIKITEAQEIANGQVYTGRQALEYGLVDKVGTEDDALDYFKDNNINVNELEVVDYDIRNHEKFSISNVLNSFIGSKLYNNAFGGFKATLK